MDIYCSDGHSLDIYLEIKKEIKLIINDKANYYYIETQSPMVLLAQHKNIIIK